MCVTITAPLLAIPCGHPKFKSIASQRCSASMAAFTRVSGSFAQNYMKKRKLNCTQET